MSGKAEPTAALQRKRSLSATANTYSRLGQVSTITDGSGLRTFNYNLSASWRLDNEALPAFYGSRLLTRLYVPDRGDAQTRQKNAVGTAEENAKEFVALRRPHSAVESDINCLEPHGLNRCLDIGLEGYQRSVGYGVLSHNLHVIGRELQERLRRRIAAERAAERAAA